MTATIHKDSDTYYSVECPTGGWLGGYRTEAEAQATCAKYNTPEREAFERAVQTIMLRDYLIEAEGPIWNDGDTPEEWVKWYADKYELVHRDTPMALDEAKAIMRSVGWKG